MGFEGFEISGAGTNGICVDSGSNNRVVGNWVLGSALSGIELGGVINVVTDNRVDNSRLLGIRVRGFGNNVLRNVAMNSHDRGFFVEGDRNILTNNQSVGNNFSGFAITGVGNRLVRNIATKNDGGFWVGGGSGFGRNNRFIRNVATKNRGTGFTDFTFPGSSGKIINFYKRNKCRNNAGGGSSSLRGPPDRRLRLCSPQR